MAYETLEIEVLNSEELLQENFTKKVLIGSEDIRNYKRAVETDKYPDWKSPYKSIRNLGIELLQSLDGDLVIPFPSGIGKNRHDIVFGYGSSPLQTLRQTFTREGKATVSEEDFVEFSLKYFKCNSGSDIISEISANNDGVDTSLFGLPISMERDKGYIEIAGVKIPIEELKKGIVINESIFKIVDLDGNEALRITKNNADKKTLLDDPKVTKSLVTENFPQVMEKVSETPYTSSRLFKGYKFEGNRLVQIANLFRFVKGSPINGNAMQLDENGKAMKYPGGIGFSGSFSDQNQFIPGKRVSKTEEMIFEVVNYQAYNANLKIMEALLKLAYGL